VSIWIYTDADNTLWDTDALFTEAQLSLLGATEGLVGITGPKTDRLKFVREFDQAIARRHHAGLRYPPALLVRSLTVGLRGTTPEAAAQEVVAEGSRPSTTEAEALEAYARILSGVPPLLSGVREGLVLAQQNDSPVYVVTEGPLELVQSRLRALNVERFTAGALSAAKSPDLYARLRQRAAPRQAAMIGDQLDRDIRFAREGGLKTILIRGRFRPSWTDGADVVHADQVATDFLQAIQFALKWAAAPSTKP